MGPGPAGQFPTPMHAALYRILGLRCILPVARANQADEYVCTRLRIASAETLLIPSWAAMVAYIIAIVEVVCLSDKPLKYLLQGF